MRTLQINHLAVLAAVVALSGFGALWYGPLMGDQWMRLVGLDMATIEANPPGIEVWISNLVSTVIPVYVLAWLFVELKVETVVKGAMLGLVIGFAFFFLRNLTGNLFAQQPYGLTWVDGGYNMACFLMAGAILGAWRKYKVVQAA
ncbi:MAG: DUF1761 domain-containing protein [Bacteroidia bacterium]|nr:DUF1761 domain-containing protein [Bacteroidia bacterium]